MTDFSLSFNVPSGTPPPSGTMCAHLATQSATDYRPMVSCDYDESDGEDCGSVTVQSALQEECA